MSINHESDNGQTSMPPEGWLNTSQLTVACGRSSELTRKVVDELKEICPDGFANFKLKNGQSVEFLSPDLVEIARERLYIEQAPEGWETNSSLAEKLGVHKHTINRAVAGLKSTDQDGFKLFLTPEKHVVTHFSPDIAAEVAEKVGQVYGAEPVPDEWLTINGITKVLGRSHRTVKNAAIRLSEENPDFVKTFRDSRHRLMPHYSPELVAQLSKELLTVETAPDGWLTKEALAKQVGKNWMSIKELVDSYREDHPEWFREFMNERNRSLEHLSPELIDALNQRLENNGEDPDGWKTNRAIAEANAVAHSVVKRIAERYLEEKPEWFEMRKGQLNRVWLHYHPELVEIIENEISKYEPATEDYIPVKEAADILNLTEPTFRKMLEEKYQGFVKEFRTAQGKPAKHVSIELVETLQVELAEELRPAPNGWITTKAAEKALGMSHDAILRRLEMYRESNPEWFQKFRAKHGRIELHLAPELIRLIAENWGKIVPVESAADEWVTKTELAEEIGIGTQLLNKLLDESRDEHPEWFAIYRDKAGRALEHISIQAAESIRSMYIKAPEGWLTLNGATDLINSRLEQMRISRKGVMKLIDEVLSEHPDWVGYYGARTRLSTPHYSPELIDELDKILTSRMVANIAIKEANASLERIYGSAQKFLNEVSEGETLEAQEFQRLIRLFGSERTVDILFQHHPDYQKIDVPFAKKVIGEYLGEFLVVRGGLELDSLELGTPYLSNPNLKEGLREIIKNDCLKAYNQRRRDGTVEDDLTTFEEYISDLREKTAHYSTDDLAEVLNEVEEYYRSLFEAVQIPDNVVDELEPGRLFPDVNQRINILELMGKQKMLIADEMGVGKSASAILAKESLGVKQALVVVPSNVIEVWQRYLSDYRNGDGETVGYFKPGQAPRVLTIDNGVDVFNSINPSDYDYIIISQEKLKDSYMAQLDQFDYDMLIVDEAHKLKNITSGKWAENLVKLAGKIEGDDKYLALLSGTPVPNKVGDIAMVLKLLYPEKFEGIANKDITREILNGDVLDLRRLLVPRMQMKSLAESVEMPQLNEELHVVEMSRRERDAYDVLLEEDELTATDKLRILRQFILNPQAFEMTPDLESSKIAEVGEALHSTFQDKNKVVMFFNGYIDGVIRGENTIFDKLDLPEDVEVHVIDGKVRKPMRLKIQNLLQSSTDKKILLAVSGQTADVGVDFSGAEELYFYNEPWTEYDKKQQQGRVYRPGLKQDLVSHTFYVEGSVEEGIHKYIEYKYNAVEKLLRGIPLSELERELLREDEKQVDPNLEVNPALAEHYLSSWHRLLKIYSYVKGIGEQDFVKFINKYGREYAECYTDIGSRSYQANVGRLAGTVIDSLAKSKSQDPQFVRILDVASGPEMLKRHIAEEYQDQVVSVDINPHHFEEVDEKRRVGSFLDLPAADNTVDYANLSLALHYTKLSLRQGIYEPIKVFQELNRVLVNEGVAVINLMHNNDLKNPELFAKAIEKVGFKVVEGLSGEVSSANNFKSRMIVLQKVGSCTQDTSVLVQQIGAPQLQGFKLAKTDVKIKDSRKIVTTFLLNGAKKIKAKLNNIDEAVLSEEQTTLSNMKSLRRKYGSIQNIPKETIYQSGLARAFTGKTYVLFKSLEAGNGAVITR